MAAVHPGGAGSSGAAGQLQQDPLESHEVSGRGERGEVHLQIHPAADGTLRVEGLRGGRGPLMVLQPPPFLLQPVQVPDERLVLRFLPFTRSTLLRKEFDLDDVPEFDSIYWLFVETNFAAVVLTLKQPFMAPVFNNAHIQTVSRISYSI